MLRYAKLQVHVENFHTFSFMYFLFIFLQRVTITSSQETLKVCGTLSFRKYKWKVVLLVIYLLHYDSSKSTFFMLTTVFVK